MSKVYVGFNEYQGVKVEEEDAFDYARDHLDELSEEDKRGFVEWFFSGNFIRKEC